MPPVLITLLAETDELYDNPIHPYTRDLLSAVPIPDPEIEKERRRNISQPDEYLEESSVMVEVFPNHFVAESKAHLAQKG